MMKYHEFIGCGGWDGETEKQGQDGAILIDVCPLVEHPGNKKVNSPGPFAVHFTKQHRKVSGTS